MFTRIGEVHTRQLSKSYRLFLCSRYRTHACIEHISHIDTVSFSVLCIGAAHSRYVSDIDIRHRYQTSTSYIDSFFVRFIGISHRPRFLFDTHQVWGRGGRLVRGIERNLAVRRIFGVQHRLLHNDGRRRWWQQCLSCTTLLLPTHQKWVSWAIVKT